METIFRIDRDKWKIVLATVKTSQQSVCNAIGLDKAAFSSRLRTGGKFSPKEIKIISDLINVDPSSFLIDDLDLWSHPKPTQHDMITIPVEAYDAMVYQIKELKQELEDIKTLYTHEPTDNT